MRKFIELIFQQQKIVCNLSYNAASENPFAQLKLFECIDIEEICQKW